MITERMSKYLIASCIHDHCFREAMQGRQVVIFQRAKNYFQVRETEGLMSETT